MKKAISVLLILFILLTLTGCPKPGEKSAQAPENTAGEQNPAGEQTAADVQTPTGAQPPAGDAPAPEETPENDAAYDDEIVEFDDEENNTPSGYVVDKGDFHWLHNEDGSVWLDRYTGSAETVVIPDTEEGIPVTGIDVWAFRENKTMKHLVIPDTVTTIEENVFMGCSALEDVKMPPRLDMLGDQVFMECTALKKITVPDGVPGLVYMEFAYCTSLEEIVLPASITEITEKVFFECGAVKKICFKGSADAWSRIPIRENGNPAHYGSQYEVICDYAG